MTDNKIISFGDLSRSEVSTKIGLGNKQDKTDNSLTTTDKTITGAINEVNSIAKGKSTGLVFDTKSDMEEWLSADANKDILKQGDNLYIIAIDVPDYWISAVLDTKSPTTGFWYEISELETQKVDLSQYYTKSETYNKTEVYNKTEIDDTNNSLVHKTTNESILGKKTFTDEIGVTQAASIQYDSTNECIKFIFN